MKITEILKTEGGYSFELIPPKPDAQGDFLAKVETLMAYKPKWFAVTNHSPESLEFCAQVQSEFGLPVVAHFLRSDFSALTLRELRISGIENLFLLRGDQTGEGFASDLVKRVKILDPSFCIGVAGYPEKHIEAVDLTTDIQNLKTKVDSGSDYIVTQMFYDNEVFYKFVALCRTAGIKVPIIPGLKLTTTNAERFHVKVPKDYRGPGHQIADLKKNGYSHIQIFMMNDFDEAELLI